MKFQFANLKLDSVYWMPKVRQWWIPIFVSLLFFGAMVWAKSDDPFVRKWFKVQTAHGQLDCVAVLPKPVRACPVVFWLHDSGGALMTDGKPLRQVVELGLTTVSLEFNQTNMVAFAEQFSSLINQVRLESWGTNHSVAWVGSGLGARFALGYFARHPQEQPDVFVGLGDFGEEITNLQFQVTNGISSDRNTQFLFIQNDLEGRLSSAQIQKLARQLADSQSYVEFKSIPNAGNSSDSNYQLIIRLVGEYCKAHLTPNHPKPEFTRPATILFLICIIPALVWAAYWIFWGRKKWKLPGEVPINSISANAEPLKLNRWDWILRIVAVVMALLAAGQTALHMVPPRMQVSPQTLKIARDHIIAPKWTSDFEALSTNTFWQGQKLKTLLTHVELAHYTVYELINWKLDEAIYRDYVLSPAIDPAGAPELNWRRSLWEFYYPRIRKENTTTTAAEIIARTLRERVTIWPDNLSETNQWPRGIETIWANQITDATGFERIYVATLRSVGVPARLDASGKAEHWDSGKWYPAPRPILSSWKDLATPHQE